MKNLKKIAVAAAAAVASGVASAAVDASVTTGIASAATDVATVGAAVLLVFVGVKLFKWIRGAL